MHKLRRQPRVKHKGARVAKISTYSGPQILIDDDILDREIVPNLKVRDAKWLVIKRRNESNSGYYPYVNPTLRDGTRISRSLISLILNAPGGKVTHRNGNECDFRRDNLNIIYTGNRRKTKDGNQVEIFHCPHTRWVFNSFGERNELCHQCNVRDIYDPDPLFRYDKCLDIASDRNWANWVPHEHLVIPTNEQELWNVFL